MASASKRLLRPSYAQLETSVRRAAAGQWVCSSCIAKSRRAAYSSAAAAASSTRNSSRQTARSIEIDGLSYATDNWFNVPPNVAAHASRKLHLQKDHPVSITRQIIESVYPQPTYKYYNDFHPVVSTFDNFDSLGFPPDHPGRAKSDTYYINKDTLLRTHTSAHEAAIFSASESEGYLISADVYRRDEVDRSHYPVFHQMEGARKWDRTQTPDVSSAIWTDLESLPKHNMAVEDPNPPFHEERNPVQAKHHSPAEVEAIAAHLKRSLELMVVEIFTRAKAAAARSDPSNAAAQEPLKVRWVEAYFPFTSPSWELEVYYAGDWLEVLGCGVTQQSMYINAGQPNQLGWAFGIGLERIAMLLFDIPDIRLFWSTDERFLSQFTGVSANLDLMKRFVPFSKHPACYKDMSFWLPSTVSAAGGNDAKASAQELHQNDVMEVIRSVAGDIVEDVALTDAFTHPVSGRRSMCYRINYRSLERTLTNVETNEMHETVREAMVERLGVELR